MKKILLLLLVAVLAVSMLAGCSGGAAPKDPADVKGETFGDGNVSALVPTGWMGFNGADFFQDYEEGYDPNVIQIAKGAKSEFDLFSKPYIQINYYGAETSMAEPYSDLYDDVVELDPVSIGSRTWNGFTAKSADLPIAILWTEDGEDQYQLTIWLESGNSKISLEDAEVKAIIASIAAK